MDDFKSKSFGAKPFGLSEHLNQDMPRSLYEDLKLDMSKLTRAKTLGGEGGSDAYKSIFGEVLSAW